MNTKAPKQKQAPNKGKVLRLLLRAVPKAGSRKGLWSECQSSTVSGMEARSRWEAWGKGEEPRLSYRAICRLV